MTRQRKDRRTLLATTRMPDLFEPQKPLASISPVTIDPKSTIVEQKQALDYLIASKPVGSIPITITPDLADYILTLNFPKNRRKKPVMIKRYSKDMEDNKWVMNGSTIVFADDGLMHDGQNRMHACIRAGVPFTTQVIFGVSSSEAFTTIDTGKTKSGDDMLTNAGYTNAAARSAALHWLIVLEGANIKARTEVTPPAMLLDRQKKLDADGEADQFEDAMKQSDVIYRRTKVLVKSTLAPFLFLYGKHDPNAISMITRDAAGDKGKMRTLKITLEGLISHAHRSVQDTVRNAYIIITFNAYCAKVQHVKNDLKWTSADPYPTPSWKQTP